MRDQRGQHREPRLLVDDAIQSLIGETPLLAFTLRHRRLRRRDRARAPSGTGRRRTEWPSQAGRMAQYWRARVTRGLPPDTRYPPRTCWAAATGTRQTRRD